MNRRNTRSEMNPSTVSSPNPERTMAPSAMFQMQ